MIISDSDDSQDFQQKPSSILKMKIKEEVVSPQGKRKAIKMKKMSKTFSDDTSSDEHESKTKEKVYKVSPKRKLKAEVKKKEDKSKSSSEVSSENEEERKTKGKCKPSPKTKSQTIKKRNKNDSSSDDSLIDEEKHKIKKNISKGSPQLKLKLDIKKKNQKENESSTDISSEDEKPKIKGKVSKELLNVKTEVQNVFNEMESDDEVFTLQCPKNMDPKSLIDVELDFIHPEIFSPGKSNRNFSVQFLKSNDKGLNLIAPGSDGIISVASQGHLLIRECLAVPEIVVAEDRDERVAFPSDIKERHPLLGVNWVEHIEISEKCLSKFKKMEKKKKRLEEKRKRKLLEVETVIESEEKEDHKLKKIKLDSSNEETQVQKRKKKKS